MPAGLVQRFLRISGPAGRPSGHPHQAPRPGQPQLVSMLPEDVGGAEAVPLGLLPVARSLVGLHVPLAHQHVSGEALVTAPVCLGGGLSEDFRGPVHLSTLAESLGEVDQELHSPRILLVDQRRCPGEQGDGRVDVHALQSPLPGRRLVPCRPRGQPGEDLPVEAKLRPVPVGLLEVVAQDLLELGEAVGRPALQPAGEPLVHLGASLLGGAGVGGVADQDVAEPERVLADEPGPVGADQFPADQSLEVASDAGLLGLGRELGHGAPPEHLSHHRGSLDHRSLLSRQSLQPRGQQSVDRRRDGELREVSRGGPPAVVPAEESVIDEHP